MTVSEAATEMEDLLALIDKTWGYRELRPLQEPAMRAFIERRDSVVVLPTGGGKSLCYQAPAMYMSQRGMGPTVVVSPLIALMKDQVDSLREWGVAAAQLDSSLSAEDRRAVTQDMRQGRLHMLFVSPERLVGAAGGEGLQAMLREAGVTTLPAIDEAHCVSHWGHDFRPEYRQLGRLKEIFPDAAVHAFTATATTQVRRDIAEQLKLRNPEMLVGNFDRPNLTYRVLPRREMFGQIREVLDRHKNEAGIIYCIRRKDVDAISAVLADDETLGRKVAGYHAGMSPDLRRRVQEDFIEEKCDLIVATIAFGMGIDRSNIRFVLHTGMPKSVEAYQQETGCAGRDGLEAECVLLYSGQDAMTWKSIIEKSAGDAGAGGVRLDPKYLPAALKHVEDMDRFARGATCRHKGLVEYFGQAYQGPAEDAQQDGWAARGCGACDMCLGDTTAVPDSTVIAQKILSCVARTDQRFGVGHVIGVLRGENTDRIRKLRHNELSTYGLLKGYSQPELRDFVYQLIGQEALAQENLVLSTGHTAAILKLNGNSVEVMRGNRQVRLVQIVRKTAEESRKTRGETVSWEGVDQELFETLRGFRKQWAIERSVPPYQIFSDATLRELARVRPTTMLNLRTIYGIGEHKLKEFSGKVLPVIDEHCKARRLATDVKSRPAVAESITPTSANSTRINPHKEEAFRMFRGGAGIEETAAKTGRAKATITEYLAEFIERENPPTIEQWVPPEVYEQVKAAAKHEGMDRLKPLFIALDEKVSYDQIRLVVAHLKAKA